MHAQEVALQDQRRQMILAQQRIDEDRAAQRLLGKLDDNDDHVQVRDLDQKQIYFLSTAILWSILYPTSPADSIVLNALHLFLS